MFFKSVRLSGSHWTDFHEIWIFFENLTRNFKFLLKSDKNYGYFTWRPLDVSIVSRSFLEWEMFQVKVVEKMEKHFLCPITFSFWKCCRFWHKVQKKKILYSRTRHRWKHGACAMHAGHLTPRTHTHNMERQVKIWWHTRRNKISSFGQTDESI